MKDNYIAAFDQNMDLIWATYHGSDKYDYCGGLALSEDNNRLMMVGTGNQGSTYMNVPSFDPEDYSTSDDDYYQPSPVPQAPFVPIGQGVLFDVSNIGIPVSVENPTAIVEMFQIFPNPSENLIQIKSKYRIRNIVITDLSGRVVYKYKSNSSTDTVDISKLSSGTYIITCISSNASYSRKLVKL